VYAMFDQGVQALDQVFGEGLVLFGPFFYFEQRIPIVTDFVDIALAALDISSAFDDAFGLGQGETVAFDAGGVMRETQAGAAAQFGLGLRRQRRVFDYCPRRFDLHQPAGDGGSEGVVRLPR